MPHGHPNARVHLIQIDDRPPGHALLDCPEGVGAGCTVELYCEAEACWVAYRVRSGETQRHAIPLTRTP